MYYECEQKMAGLNVFWRVGCDRLSDHSLRDLISLWKSRSSYPCLLHYAYSLICLLAIATDWNDVKASMRAQCVYRKKIALWNILRWIYSPYGIYIYMRKKHGSMEKTWNLNPKVCGSNPHLPQRIYTYIVPLGSALYHIKKQRCKFAPPKCHNTCTF